MAKKCKECGTPGCTMSWEEHLEVYEMELWANEQRKDYKAGKLKPEQIKKLESLPGWTWKLTKL